MYKLTNKDAVIKTDEGLFIPMVGGNRHYQEYLDWVALGNTAEPADPEPMPTIIVSPRQFRLALNKVGLRDQVEQAVAAASQDVRDMWEYSLELRSDDLHVAELAGAIGADSVKIMEIFVSAQSL
jgi:hypothetical protein